MKYEIIGNTVPAVEVTLNKGESMYTQKGGMAWQTEGIKMSTNVPGGILKGIGRKLFAGESLFMNTYEAEKEDVKIGFASTVPGNIKVLNLSEIPNGMMIQKGAFLCAEPDVKISIALTKKLSAGFFGGEGFVLQKAEGKGHLFLEVDGDQIEKDLAPGEVLKVNTGNVVAFEKSVSYEIELVKGIGNILLGGEGLFITRLKGPGKVLIQTQNFQEFAGRILSFLPTKID